MAVVKVNYIKGEKAIAAARAAGDYYTFREGPDQATRTWQTPEGEKVYKWKEIRTEIGRQAKEHKYTYRIVLSQEKGTFGPEHYDEVLKAAGIGNAYFVIHDNTPHQHAHAIAFTEKRMTRKDFAMMRGRMAELENTVEKSAGAERAVSQGQDRGGGLGL